MKLAVSVLVLAIALTACARQHVVTQPDVPPLAPPAPPPRVVAPPEAEEPAPSAKPAEAPARSKPPRGGPPARVVEPPHEAPKPEEKPPAPTPPRPDTVPSTLQTLPVQTQAEMKKQVTALMAQAENDLAKVDYKRSNSDARGQYDQAKRFITQAKQALQEQNFVLAQRLAEKAATIAGVLLGR